MGFRAGWVNPSRDKGMGFRAGWVNPSRDKGMGFRVELSVNHPRGHMHMCGYMA